MLSVIRQESSARPALAKAVADTHRRTDRTSLAIYEAENVTFRTHIDAVSAADALGRVHYRVQCGRLIQAAPEGFDLG